MPIITGPLNDRFNDHVGGITGGESAAGTTDHGYRWDDPARFGALDAPSWIPTGSHRMSPARIVYAEDIRPGNYA